MSNLSENYYLRECYFRRQQVPTISVMKKKMTPRLAAVYFNSMKPKIKELAGLEPSLEGGGSDWYQPPEELLEGRAVLKPVRKQVLGKLNYLGIDDIGMGIFQRHRKEMDSKIEQALLDSDINWRSNVKATCDRLWSDLVAAATKKNTDQIKQDFNKFVYFYRQSLGKIEILFHESAIAEIQKNRENSLHEMQIKYATVLKHQATLLYDKYEKKLMEEKARLKDEFIKNIQINQSAMAEKIHDLKVNKHRALEKIKQCLHCQNLACEVYVALKEREDCLKDMEELKYGHKKKVTVMKNTILMQDLQIHIEEAKEKEREEFCNTWRKKICRVIKVFQMFVSHCLHMFPDQADFFINMEKLMLLQVDEALEDSIAPSIIELEKEEFHTPIPRPKPFYLFCEQGYKPKLERDLCGKPSGTSSASEIPVMIVNKRCLYAACDNFEQFTNKIKEFIHGHRGDDADFKDDLVYEHFIPVQNTASQQMLEMKLESSLLQVLQQGLADIETDEKEFPISKCNICELTWCSCRQIDQIKPTLSTISSKAPRHTLQTKIDRNLELIHTREPKLDSFCRHVDPKKCSCAKTIKKHLTEHLPLYMRHMTYLPSELPTYEPCSLEILKKMVKEARKEGPFIPPVEFIARTKDMGTQCHEFETFDDLCTCFTDSIQQIDENPHSKSWADTGVGCVSSFYLSKSTSTFAIHRAISLRNLIKESPEIEDLFTRKDCDL